MSWIRIAVVVLGLGLLALPACRKGPRVTPEQQAIQQKVETDTGLPMPLVLPESAHALDDFDLIPPKYSAGMTNWHAPFTYAGGFETVVASFDEQLKPQHFGRLGGKLHEADPGFKIGDSIKPPTASGKKAWISEDKTIVVFLSYEFRKAPKGQTEQQAAHEYQLNVVKWDTPQEIKPPNKVVPIP